MSVLNEIIVGVRQDLATRRIPLARMVELVASSAKPIDALGSLRTSNIGLIAEVKRASPSKGDLAPISDPAALAKAYQENGAVVVSVLTEKRRFGGSLEDLVAVRKAISIPILRKDFMVDEYQFHEARAYGADLVLLIVAALSKVELQDFLALTHELGMKALVEVHTECELEQALDVSAEIIGVNSRDLKTLEVDPRVFGELLPKIPDRIIKVAESGISSRSDVMQARQFGADAVLVGEALVRGGDPGTALRTLLGRG